MNRPHAIPVFVTLAFILGLAVGPYVALSVAVLFKIAIGSLAALIATFFWAKRHWHINPVFLGLAFLNIAVIAALLGLGKNPLYNPQHYLTLKIASPQIMRVEVLEKLNPNPYQFNYLVEVKQVGEQSVEGKLLLSVRKDTLPPPLLAGESALLYAQYKPIYRPRNPYQFDYAAYMQRQGVLRQAQVNRAAVKVLPQTSFSLLYWAARLRNYIDIKLEKSDFTPSQIALMEALLLGQRGEMTAVHYQHFIDAGVVHVLAVSGLHIGILLFFLMAVFKPLIYLPHGKWIRSAVVIALLWGYAVLVGLSPSILRAVTMFSLLSLGLFFRRRSLTINMLCLSGLILLIYRPGFLYAVGFQLSYAAVLSILVFQKKLFKCFQFKHKVSRYIWGVTTVTLTAQLGVLPLSLYYFHQFPGLFFISNLLVVPFIGLLIEVGVVVLILLGLDQLPHFLTQVYGGVLDLLQHTVDWVAMQESFIIRHVYFSTEMLLVSILCLILLGFAVYHMKYKYWAAFLVGLIILEVGYAISFSQTQTRRKFYVFHKTRHTLLGVLKGHQFLLLSDSTLTEKQVLELSFMQGFQDAMDLQGVQYHSQVLNLYQLNQKQLFVIDSFGIWKLPKEVHPDIVLLRQSPKINLERALRYLKPQRVIADGSNYKSAVKRWKATCKTYKIPFHYTGKKGFATIAY